MSRITLVSSRQRAAPSWVWPGSRVPARAHCRLRSLALLLPTRPAAACAAVNVYLPKDRVTNNHQGYGFVEFKSEEDADYVRSSSLAPAPAAARCRGIRHQLACTRAPPAQPAAAGSAGSCPPARFAPRALAAPPWPRQAACGHAHPSSCCRLRCPQSIKVLNMVKLFGKPIRVNKASTDKNANDVSRVASEAHRAQRQQGQLSTAAPLAAACSVRRLPCSPCPSLPGCSPPIAAGRRQHVHWQPRRRRGREAVVRHLLCVRCHCQHAQGAAAARAPPPPPPLGLQHSLQ